MEGDLLQPGTLGPAVAGVDVVVSCVMGDEAAMVDGQASLLNAAKAAGVKKAGCGLAALWWRTGLTHRMATHPLPILPAPPACSLWPPPFQ